GHPIRTVVADESDDIAGADAELVEAERKVTDPGVIVEPSEAPPYAEVLLSQRDFAGMLRGVEPQQLRKGVSLRGATMIIHHRAPPAAARSSSRSPASACPLPRYASSTCTSARTSAGRPSAILRPKSSTIIRCEMSATTDMSCSIMITVIPNSSLRSTM